MALNKKFNLDELDFRTKAKQTNETANTQEKKEEKKESPDDSGRKADNKAKVAEEEKNAVKEEENKPADSIPKSASLNLVFKKKEKETKSVHKSFLVTPTNAEKFKALAKANGMNENELFNELLDQIFSN